MEIVAVDGEKDTTHSDSLESIVEFLVSIQLFADLLLPKQTLEKIAKCLKKKNLNAGEELVKTEDARGPEYLIISKGVLLSEEKLHDNRLKSFMQDRGVGEVIQIFHNAKEYNLPLLQFPTSYVAKTDIEYFHCTTESLEEVFSKEQVVSLTRSWYKRSLFTDYCVLDRIVSHTSAFAILLEYCEEHLNSEMALFYHDALEYLETKDDAARFSILKNIWKSYIGTDAHQQINITDEARQEVRSILDLATDGKSICPVEAMDSLIFAVSQDLRNDVRPRFLQTEHFKEALKVIFTEMETCKSLESGGFHRFKSTSAVSSHGGIESRDSRPRSTTAYVTSRTGPRRSELCSIM